MRWPWCSVAWRDAYERERAERERLTEHLLRVQRREVGLPETPPKPRETLEMPRDISSHCDGWSSQASKEAERVRVLKLYRENGKDWSKVREILFEEVAE